jgi:branched-chain amino acid transport system ATP-binding protein
VASDIVLSAEAITVQFGGLTALSAVSVVLPKGAAVGLVGPNGAGKSTLFGVLSGFLSPNAGSVMLLGEDLTKLSPNARVRKGLARTFQQPELFGALTVRDHLVLADRLRFSRARLWTDLYTFRGWHRSPQDERDRIDGTMDLLGLEQFSDANVESLPIGVTRLVEVARALATGPKVLLLDEPSAGLDPIETDALAQGLERVVRDQGVTLLLVEHDLDLVLGLSELVYVLDFGVMIASGTPNEIRRNPKVRAAYLGDVAMVEASAG